MEYKEVLEDVRDTINAEFSNADEPALMTLNSVTGRWPASKIIRSGSVELDMAIGVGGIPRGRITEIAGFESSGKTSLALHIVKNAQMQENPVIYIDAENALDPAYMNKLGVNLNQLLVHQPYHLESAMGLMLKAMDMFHEAGHSGLIVVDSIAFLKSREVIESDPDAEVSRAPEARRWSTNLPKVVRSARMTNTTIIMINQLRHSQSTKPWEQAPTSPGGSALKFAHSVKIHLRGKKVKNADRDGIDYHEVNFTLEKNKVSSPARIGKFFLEPGGPIDWYEDVYLAALRRDIIQEDVKDEGDGPFKKKGWFTYHFIDGDYELAKKDNPDLPEGTEYICAYRSGPFQEILASYPSLVESIDERILDTLDEKKIDVFSDALQQGIIQENVKYVDGGLSEKKGWFTYEFIDGDYELAKKDNPDLEEGTECLSAYRADPFRAILEEYPSLTESIEERIFGILNPGKIDSITVDEDESDE